MRKPWRRGGDDEPAPDGGRARDIARLVATLRREGIQDERVLAALAAVPRERFVPPELGDRAWEDIALPIGDGQTISQPYIVAIMTEALRLRPDDRVLEIGTGSGYQAAILARLAAHVDSIERIPALADRAAATLRDQAITNVRIVVGDGTVGWPHPAVFDRMIVTAGGPDLPAPLLAQLSPDGGRLVIPIGPYDAEQRLFLVERTGDTHTHHDLGPVRFVPLITRAGPDTDTA